jgi:hypothetical protein
MVQIVRRERQNVAVELKRTIEKEKRGGGEGRLKRG